MTRSGPRDPAWEVPLALLSWMFYRLTRLVFRGLARAHVAKAQRRPAGWHTLSADTISGLLQLTAITASAPRWNPHAQIHTVGPFHADRSIGIDGAAASRSARTWTAVVHRLPGSRIVGALGPSTVAAGDGWAQLDVTPGAYLIAMRYYHWSADATLPAVRADGIEAAGGAPVAADSNDLLYQALSRPRGGPSGAFFSALFLAQHYYVYTMLRLKRWLPASFVAGELLPVGNPETHFSYGHCPAGCSLHVRVPEAVLADYDVYLTQYRRDSFPVAWQQVAVPELRTAALARNSFYILRFHRSRASASQDCDGVAVTVERLPA